MAAPASRVRVLHAEEIEVGLPIRPLLGERRGTEAGLHPLDPTVRERAGLFHVVEILVAGDRTRPERAIFDSSIERLAATRLDAGGDEISHDFDVTLSRYAPSHVCLLRRPLGRPLRLVRRCSNGRSMGEGHRRIRGGGQDDPAPEGRHRLCRQLDDTPMGYGLVLPRSQDHQPRLRRIRDGRRRPLRRSHRHAL